MTICISWESDKAWRIVAVLSFPQVRGLRRFGQAISENLAGTSRKTAEINPQNCCGADDETSNVWELIDLAQSPKRLEA
jgi:hypothetical protein